MFFQIKQFQYILGGTINIKAPSSNPENKNISIKGHLIIRVIGTNGT
jgi:hypothetical protein